MSLSLALILNKSTINAMFSKAQLKSHWQQIFVIFLFHVTKLFFFRSSDSTKLTRLSGYMSIVLFWLPWLSSCSKQCTSAALLMRQDGGSREGGQGAAKALRQRELHLRSGSSSLWLQGVPEGLWQPEIHLWEPAKHPRTIAGMEASRTPQAWVIQADTC